jgi:hypothetical protein
METGGVDRRRISFFLKQIRRLNVLRLNKLSAVTMAITVALAACSDGTGLNDEPFDPGASAADL